MLVEKNNESTKLLQRKIRYMCAVEGEMEFYVLRPLFTDDVNVQAVVRTFQDVYDNSFFYEGSAEGLYQTIVRWIEKNIA
ncbi:TPA: hypothetical protein R6P00_002297 [Enterococcus faecalis]|uniref:hypothetical protein n=1 Tax=Enterococcus faecalis TaxID=1351 RepID=UPI00046C6312|nr:hypothetical protein [Enterococcus faecalis]HED9394751.1 hypothetical protein [Enterococcus faecalis]